MYRFGPYRFDTATGFLQRGTDDVPLPPRAQALLGYLLERPGQVVAKDELLDTVWDDAHVTDTSLKEAIHVLRLALGDHPRSPSYIETVPRRGYRFVHSVRRETASPALGRVPGWRLGWWIGGMTIGLVLSVLIVAQRRAPRARPPVVPQRFEIRLPPDHGVTPGPLNLALSPDGRYLGYVAKAHGSRRLFLRPVGQIDAVAVAGTEDASAPFFSPDGRWIGFFTAGGLQRVAVTGGDVETLCDIQNGLGASWGPDGIVMSLLDARDNTGLWRVPSAGGRPRVLTTRLEGEAAHRWPEVLPGGGAALFTVWHSGFDDAETALLDLETGQRSWLLAGSQARYAAPGHLIFLRAGQLWSVPFDVRRREVTGTAAPVLGGVATTPVFGTAHFAVASTGALVFMPRTETPAPVLRRVGKGGKEERREIDVDGTVFDLRLAPDGRRMAVAAMGGGGLDLWVVDLERGALARRTFDGASMGPVWSPDGRWLLFASTRQDAAGFFRMSADGGRESAALWTGEAPAVATSWSPDARYLAFSRLTPDHGWDLWILQLEDEAEAWLATPFNESRGVFSPDGRFLAYESDETGRREVYVRPFAGAGLQWTISTGGGSHPLWSRDGRQIWFRRGAGIYSVDVRLEPPIEIGRPEPRFQGSDVPGFSLAVGEAEVWLLERQETPSAPSTLTFVVNWLAEM